MTAEEASAALPDFDVWPDNWLAVGLFISIETQWRVGLSGAYGLDYNVLYRKLDRLHLTSEEYDDAEADVRTIELEALEVMRQISKDKP